MSIIADHPEGSAATKDMLSWSLVKKRSVTIPIAIGTWTSYLNVGTGKDLTIKALAKKVKATVGFEGELVWDDTKPDGTLKKLLDVSKLNGLGWKETIALEEGIKKVCENYKVS